MGCRWWEVVIFIFPKALCFRELKGSLHSSGKAYQVSWSRELHQFQLPSQGLHSIGMPPDPLLGVIKGQFGGWRLVGLIPIPGEEFLDTWVQLWGCPKSLGSSTQDCSWETAASQFHLLVVTGREVHFTLASFGSSKVTHLLGLTRLGKAAHLLPGLSGWSASKAICSLWLLCHLLLLECPLLLKHCLLPKCWQLLECPQLWCHPSEMEWFSSSICPSSITTMASTLQWSSLVTLRASSLDCCCQAMQESKWLHAACVSV